MTRAFVLQRPVEQPLPLRLPQVRGPERAVPDARAELERLVAAHFGAVRRLLERLTGSAADADDLAQECFLRARAALVGRPVADERAWLVRVAVRLAQDHARGRGRARRRDERAGRDRLERRPAGEAPEAGLERRELLEDLRAAVADLPERLRLPLVLRVYEGLDYDAIAERVGRRPATVRVLVMQARRELERVLGARLDAEGWR